MVFQTHQRRHLARLREKIAEPVLRHALNASGQDHPHSAAEMTEVYLPLSYLLRQRIDGARPLPARDAAGADTESAAAPFIIGLTGSVAVGKSSAAKLLQHALAAWPEYPRVAVVNGDGFLHPNAVLKERGLMERKGFPETYDHDAVADFVMRLKRGEREVAAPLYSHRVYDVMKEDTLILRGPQIVIIEGINIFRPGRIETAGARPFGSGLLDFSIYLHAEEALIKRWFTERFVALTEAAVTDPNSFYRRFVPLSDTERLALVDHVWININGKNLNENILPGMPGADMILHKGADHVITHIEHRDP